MDEKKEAKSHKFSNGKFMASIDLIYFVISSV